jgi:hypothetical protein
MAIRLLSYPALQQKPGLIDAWQLHKVTDHMHALDARAVLQAARFSPRCQWSAVLPHYHQMSAPELQRNKLA